MTDGCSILKVEIKKWTACTLCAAVVVFKFLRTPDVAGHHSVIVNPGPVQNHPNANGEQVHREFVIFDGAAVYPEYVVGINQ